ncbi:unnamed protein product, partial [marine sediment metagenome]
KILYLGDESTWDDGDLPPWQDITSATLAISYKTPEIPDGTIDYNKDVIDIFTAATEQSDLVFSVTSVDLELGSNVPLPDGIYSIDYTVSDGVGTWSFPSRLELLLDNIIKFEVYRIVGSTPAQYVCANNYYTKPIDDNLLIQSLYDALQANAYVAKQNGILQVLETLQRQTA